VEDRQEAGEPALTELLVDDVGGVKAGLRAGGRGVVDLDRHRRPVDVNPCRGLDAGQRAENGLCLGSRWGTFDIAAAVVAAARRQKDDEQEQA
jgi:hypothetical protein